MHLYTSLHVVRSWVMKSMKGMWTRNIMAGLGFGVASGVMCLEPIEITCII